MGSGSTNLTPAFKGGKGGEKLGSGSWNLTPLLLEPDPPTRS